MKYPFDFFIEQTEKMLNLFQYDESSDEYIVKNKSGHITNRITSIQFEKLQDDLKLMKEKVGYEIQ